MKPMPRAVHHVVLSTDAPDAVRGFLTDLLGMPAGPSIDADLPLAGDILGWPGPGEGGGLHTDFFGADGGMGQIEVAEIPERLRDQVGPGVSVVSFLVRDLSALLARCAERGIEAARFESTNPVPMAGAVVTVGGIRFELLQLT
jgi:catechol 2,3-dioxygenase-like lactoylglutathione lyase family enzyme